MALIKDAESDMKITRIGNKTPSIENPNSEQEERTKKRNRKVAFKKMLPAYVKRESLT